MPARGVDISSSEKQSAEFQPGRRGDSASYSSCPPVIDKYKMDPEQDSSGPDNWLPVPRDYAVPSYDHLFTYRYLYSCDTDASPIQSQGMLSNSCTGIGHRNERETR
ncbi:hypothetical protein DPEC_G00270090 [Dallia pectoralis]|uniref:Uncharacterized protein n=1 Tax=Dallia pectoralis TaxID=75939 RepID=A0ACC2FPN9_DALPE|nr:hypothetical protein DPEC_G00270090 [Dallia pectoralis]